MNAMADYEFVADYYPVAEKNGDSYYVQSSVNHMKSGGMHAQKVSDKLAEALRDVVNK